MAGLFKVVVRSIYSANAANPFINVFGYRSNLTVVNEEQELSNQWIAQILPEMVKILASNMVVDRVEVYNVSNGTGYVDAHPTTGNVGLRTGEVLSPFLAVGFQYNRLLAGKRNGFKRFGAITETDVSGYTVSAGYLTVLNTFATKLSAAIKVALIDTWFPEILERKPAGVFPWTSHQIASVQYKRLTTQNSRKPGF